MSKYTSKDIQIQNDQFRKAFVNSSAGRIVLTSSVASLRESDPRLFEEIIEAVKNFDNFNGDNDPYQEHDSFSFNVKGTTYYAKIDYYENSSLEYGVDQLEEDCFRLLTIMEMSEY